MAFLRPAVALLIALGTGIALGGGESAAARPDGRILLAQVDDPSLPSYVTPTTRRPRSAPREQVIPPFALPTSPITASRPSADHEQGASPGGAEFPPYEKELVRLAEILGAVHYLRDLCGAGDGAQWRDRMEALIAAEEPNAAWRGRLMDSFNTGYQAYERAYHSCTPAAARAATVYVAEGKTLTGTIKARYTN